MITNKQRGNEAEDLAATFLENLGFKLLEKNYRYKRSEIDLIMSNDSLMVFVEVKYRSSTKFGQPEGFVSSNQQTKIIEAADEYIHQKNWQGNIRFDIIAINLQNEIVHFEDAFY